MKEIELGSIGKTKKEVTPESFIHEGDLFINKLVDDCFYINEGVRYFLIYQIVDNATYGTGEGVSLKSLLMPITMKREEYTTTSEITGEAYDFYTYDVLLFSKALNPILYLFTKDAYNSLVSLNLNTEEDIYDSWVTHRDVSLIEKFNTFFDVDFKFSPSLSELSKDDDRVIFKLSAERAKDENSCFVSVKKSDLEVERIRTVIGSLLNIKNTLKKKRIGFSYDQLISPWFWVDTVSEFFTKNNDYLKKFYKIKTMLLSLNRLIDETTRSTLNLESRDKENTLTILRYMMENFDELVHADSQNLDQKRLRLFEYQLYPLRQYFSNQIYRVLNSPTRSKAVLDRIFSNLNPLFIIKGTVTSELLRYYNSTNDMNLFSAFLKYTFRGPQSLNKVVSMEQRDLHPSYTGRLSLIASSASDPGLSGSLTPFVEVYDYYFAPQEKGE